MKSKFLFSPPQQQGSDSQETPSPTLDFPHHLVAFYYQTNLAGEILMISPSVTEHLGYLPCELIGKKITEFNFDTKTSDAYLQRLHKNYSQPIQICAKLRHRRGFPVSLETDCSVRVDQQGHPLFIEYIANICSEKEPGEEQLRKEIQHLRMLTQVLCHDLANPLSTILSIFSLDEKLIAQFSTRMRQAAQSGMDIIDLVRKMQSCDKHNELTLEKVCVQEVLDSLQSNFESRLSAKQVTLEIQSEPTLFVHAEKVSLEHSVLANFLSNALKFSIPGGLIHISAQLVDDEQVCFTIQDHGVGMSKKLLGTLFDLSKKSTRIGTAHESGTGYGLKLSLFFIEKFGGTINVTSTCQTIDFANAGTTVKAYVPRYPEAVDLIQSNRLLSDWSIKPR